MAKPNAELAAQLATAPNTNAEIQTTTITQFANEILGTPEKQLYYLIIKTQKGKRVVNIGQKTHDEIYKLISQ